MGTAKIELSPSHRDTEIATMQTASCSDGFSTHVYKKETNQQNFVGCFSLLS